MPPRDCKAATDATEKGDRGATKPEACDALKEVLGLALAVRLLVVTLSHW